MLINGKCWDIMQTAAALSPRWWCEHNIYTVILCQYVDVSEERGSGLHNVPTFSINQHLSSARPSAGDINRLLNR